MIFLNLLVGILAGYLTPIMEPKLKSLAESILLGPVKIKESEFDMLSLLIMLMAAHAVISILGAESSVFMMCGGAILGFFGKPIWAMLLAKTDGRQTK